MSRENQKIIFVTGKGGVGKSTVAAALALSASQEGKRTLLVELGDLSYFKDYLALDEVGYSPKEIFPNLYLALWTGQASLREYALHLLKLESLVHLFFDNFVMRTLVNVAPGLPELALTGKITSGYRKIGPPLNYDVVIIDAYASGHMMALLKAPRGMAETIRMGPMGEQSRGIQKVLQDPTICEFRIVTLAEELPVTETFELANQIESELGLKSKIILNKVINSGLSDEELETIKKSGTGDESKFADFILTLEHRQNQYRKQLLKLDSNLREIPFILESDPMTTLKRMSEAVK
ncbi:MAG: ArsA-related P-loop ATPase [Pseudobdellovibrionaceae bacterium]